MNAPAEEWWAGTLNHSWPDGARFAQIAKTATGQVEASDGGR